MVAIPRSDYEILDDWGAVRLDRPGPAGTAAHALTCASLRAAQAVSTASASALLRSDIIM